MIRSVLRTFCYYLPNYLETLESMFRSRKRMMEKVLRKKGAKFEVLPAKNPDEWIKHVRAGDIIISRFEGVWAPVLPNFLNHCAIYVGGGKLIEATEDGVVETETSGYDATACLVLRVREASPAVRRGVVKFAASQLGKLYNVNWWHKGCSPDKKRWACSELVWAAYWNGSVESGMEPLDLSRKNSRRAPEGYDPHSPVSPTDILMSPLTDVAGGFLKHKKKFYIVRRISAYEST